MITFRPYAIVRFTHPQRRSSPNLFSFSLDICLVLLKVLIINMCNEKYIVLYIIEIYVFHILLYIYL